MTRPPVAKVEIMKLAASLIGVAAILSGCGSFLPMEQASPEVRLELERMPYFTPSTASLQPKIKAIVGPVEGHSCKSLPTDPVNESIALEQLKLRARTLGANGLVDVRFDRAGTSLGTNCWQSITASGTAVVFDLPTK